MKKKVVAGLIAITALSMIVGGCGVNSHLGNEDENTSSTESSNASSSDAGLVEVEKDDDDDDEDDDSNIIQVAFSKRAYSSSDADSDSDNGVDFSTLSQLSFKACTGDKVDVFTNGYKLGRNKEDESCFDIKVGDKVIATGTFITSDQYDSYYGSIKEDAVEIEDISFNEITESSFINLDKDGVRTYNTLGWVNGSNTGFIVNAVDGDCDTVKNAVYNLTFAVEVESGDGVDKVALPDKVEGDDVYEDSSNSDEAVSNENASDNVVVPDGFEVNYECEYFTDYDKGDITVRINHGDYDEEVNQFLKGNPDYLDAATLSDAGTYKMGDREVQAIKSDGHIDDMDTGYVKYYFVGDGVNASIYNRVNDELTVEDAEELVSEFYE